MTAERVEVLVLGSGEGGKYLAWHMAQAGRRVAVVERRWIGGSCPNINCLPSKNEIWSAEVAHLVRHAGSFGSVTTPVTVDMAAVRKRKRDMVDGLIAMHLGKYEASGAELIMGTGHFVGPKTLEVHLNDGGTRRLVGDRVFLNVGTHATIPDIPGLAAAQPLTHIEALELDRVPEHLIVLGGGYVGLELAQAYRRFGSRVTIVERGLSSSVARMPTSRTRSGRSSPRTGSTSSSPPPPPAWTGGRAKGCACSSARPGASRPSRAAISWPPRGARPTPPGSGSRPPAWPWTSAATSRSTTGWRRRRPGPGPSASARAARSSRTSPSTILGSSGTISPEGTAPRATGSSPSACSSTRRSPGSA